LFLFVTGTTILFLIVTGPIFSGSIRRAIEAKSAFDLRRVIPGWQVSPGDQSLVLL
jgi:hypothetical protein